MLNVSLLISQIFTLQTGSFGLGILCSLLSWEVLFHRKVLSTLTLFLLFSIGFKGGGALIGHFDSHMPYLASTLVIWGLIQPFLSYGILRRLTSVDPSTAAAIAACFGSISIMTYSAGTAFLEKLEIDYDGFIVALLAIMEVPAIISGLLIAKMFNPSTSHSLRDLMREVLVNKTVWTICAGMVAGGLSSYFQWQTFSATLLLFFYPCLSLFLFKMGWLVGGHREHLKQFSWSLICFGLYMPLLGAFVGILIAYFFNIALGTGTLIAILTASASYIAAPATMKIALPESKESVYLPLSLGIAFPFNVILGIPFYHQMAVFFLN